MCHSAERHAGRSLQHLTTALTSGASPQGEAFEGFASKPYALQYGYVEFWRKEK